MKTISSVIEYIDTNKKSSKDKGDMFEYACKYFLENDPFYSPRFSKVWLWQQSPICTGQDVGVDLVAEDIDYPGRYWAIQCKAFSDDSTLAKAHIDSFFNEAGKDFYVGRIVMSTTNTWSKHALQAMSNWQATKITTMDMDTIDWTGFLENSKPAGKKVRDLRPHQKEALEAVKMGFETGDRGKMIMACGTGKTYTSLRIAEELAPQGLILFLAPSISLISQTISEWTQYSQKPLRAFAVCSDEKVTKKDSDEIITNVNDIPFPASTDVSDLVARIKHHSNKDGMTVIFSTYQSIQVIIDAQKNSAVPPFDLIVCDEAHRTTGVKDVTGSDESHFTKVHDRTLVNGAKRLYMTATPRIYGDQAKMKARASDYTVASMDDESLYGPEFYHLSFGTAVSKQLLSDYKVLVLVIDENMANEAFQSEYAVEGELPVPERARIIGCWNGLATRGIDHGPARPLKTAVAFAGTIADSKKLQEKFQVIIDAYIAKTHNQDVFRCDVDHVDGSMDSVARKKKLNWLRDAPADNKTCRILSNSRCLSEGVDVPALDAVIFMKPRRSKVDIIQAVGRVMRRAEGKDYGYIVLPIFVPAGVEPEDTLNNNKAFEVVWEVLQALRSHDERLDAYINSIEFDKSNPKKDSVPGKGSAGAGDGEGGERIVVVGPQGGEKSGAEQAIQLAMEFPIDQWQEAIFAKIVSKCGRHIYWEEWAKDVASIAEKNIAAITELCDSDNDGLNKDMDRFLHGLRDSLNDGVTRANAIEMLAQHIITKPVFDALFSDYSFAAHNPVSIAMEEMLAKLRTFGFDDEDPTLTKFYDNVRLRVEGVTSDEGRQAIIKELYEKFFSAAFSKTSEAMGIVYTPNEIVDFILNSVDALCKAEFGHGLGDKGVHILDPFTGTGTFIVNALHSGLIAPEQLAHKYQYELHANEIVLLAYYIAAINIEHAYHSLVGGDYVPFEGAVLTDTFQMTEGEDTLDIEVFTDNSERVLHQNELPIRVIVGNPPYSIGQSSQNDNNANTQYPILNERIASSYAFHSGAGLKRGLYDSYVRAFRWASDRIGDKGVLCFVSNAGWLEGAGMDGMRKCLTEEFSSIYVFNLRGNARTSGELRRKEGGGVFDTGSRTPIAITMLVKNPDTAEQGKIFYHDIGDYLTREEKLALVKGFENYSNIPWMNIAPNKNNDWVNHRDESFELFNPMGLEKYKEPMGMFATYSLGVVTNRDAWMYNFNKGKLEANVKSTIEVFNKEVKRWQESGEFQNVKDFLDDSPTKISWTRALIRDVVSAKYSEYKESQLVEVLYRPYMKQWLYFDRQWNEVVYQMPKLFPSQDHPNLVICVSGPGSSKDWSAIISNCVTDLQMHSNGQCFPLYWYEKQDALGGLFEDGLNAEYVRHDGITNNTLRAYQLVYGDTKITKEDIFYYTYGILYSEEYKNRFGVNLKKELPRIPYAKDFWSFSEAGRQLAELHLNYETVEPYALTVQESFSPDYLVEKMRFGKKTIDGKKCDDKSTIIFNNAIILQDIPEEAYRYEVNGQSAIWWIMDRYQIKVDKASGIANNPNEWSEDPQYIYNLLRRIVTVSVETVRIVDALPPLNEIIE